MSTIQHASGAGDAPDAADARWWVRHPERLAREHAELTARGVAFTPNERALAAGIYQLDLQHPAIPGIAEAGFPLVAIYPDGYPYFPVHVEAPTITLPHHQNPFAKNLCLLGRTQRWRPQSDSLAGLLASQLEPVLIAGRSTHVEEYEELEEHVPEPITAYYPYQQGSCVLFAITPPSAVPAALNQGTLVLAVETPAHAPVPHVLRGVVLEVRDERGIVVQQADEALMARFRQARRIEARWVRAEAPTTADEPEKIAAMIYSAAERIDPRKPNKYPTDLPDVHLRARAILFREEQNWRGAQDAMGDGWAIAVRLGKPDEARKREKRVAPDERTYLARMSPYAERDLRVRAPSLSLLRHRHVAVFGLGCLGAPSALEFGRASIRSLRLLDHDFVESGTTVRWPLGIGAAGYDKVGVLKAFIQHNYPYTEIVASERHRLGGVRRVADAEPRATISLESSEARVMERMLTGADLLYDASADSAAQYFLAQTARARRIPYVGVHATPGGWGGMVIAIDPERTQGCWECVQRWLGVPVADGGFEWPASDDTHGDLLVPGCTDVTYAGVNPDLGEIALMGVRTAFGLLTGGADSAPVTSRSAYPRAPWDIAVVSLRDAAGGMIAPRWSTYTLSAHPECPVCMLGTVIPSGTLVAR